MNGQIQLILILWVLALNAAVGADSTADWTLEFENVEKAILGELALVPNFRYQLINEIREELETINPRLSINLQKALVVSSIFIKNSGPSSLLRTGNVSGVECHHFGIVYSALALTTSAILSGLSVALPTVAVTALMRTLSRAKE